MQTTETEMTMNAKQIKWVVKVNGKVVATFGTREEAAKYVEAKGGVRVVPTITISHVYVR